MCRCIRKAARIGVGPTQQNPSLQLSQSHTLLLCIQDASPLVCVCVPQTFRRRGARRYNNNNLQWLRVRHKGLRVKKQALNCDREGHVSVGSDETENGQGTRNFRPHSCSANHTSAVTRYHQRKSNGGCARSWGRPNCACDSVTSDSPQDICILIQSR